MAALHIGKRTEEVKTNVPEAMHNHLADLSRKAGCTPSELLLDALYLALTGITFAEHVANDRRDFLACQVRQHADKKANE